MPQFWKLGIGKKKSEDSQSSRSGSPKSPRRQIQNGSIPDDSMDQPDWATPPGHRPTKVYHLLQQEIDKLEDKVLSPEAYTPTWTQCSRLSKTLQEVLHDKGALGYFIQFMDAQDAAPVIRFWLEAESFRSSATQVPSAASVGGSGGASESEEAGVEKDAERIFQRFLSESASQPVLGLAEQVMESVRSKYMELKDSGVDPDCFLEAQDATYRLMEKEYFPYFLRSEFHCKHQIDVLTSGHVFLTDVVYNEAALFYFMEFMEQEGQSSLVEFWLAADNFRQHYLAKKGVYDGTEAQNDAMVLYDRYFSMQASSPLGFGDKVRLEVEHRICREGGPLPGCLDLPLRTVFSVLEKTFLPPFLESQLYLNYLSELMNTVQSSPGPMGRKKRSGSDSTCSSEQSISVQNTLLAMDGGGIGVGATAGVAGGGASRLVKNVDNRSMTIDSRQLYDPDSLWRRRHMSKLSIGRINDLGKFETEIEPEPDRKGESRLSKAVKRLVNLEESKTKEEMAWQIAEMIVKDITSVTLGLDSGSQQPSKES